MGAVGTDGTVAHDLADAIGGSVVEAVGGAVTSDLVKTAIGAVGTDGTVAHDLADAIVESVVEAVGEAVTPDLVKTAIGAVGTDGTVAHDLADAIGGSVVKAMREMNLAVVTGSSEAVRPGNDEEPVVDYPPTITAGQIQELFEELKSVVEEIKATVTSNLSSPVKNTQIYKDASSVFYIHNSPRQTWSNLALTSGIGALGSAWWWSQNGSSVNNRVMLGSIIFSGTAFLASALLSSSYQVPSVQTV
jgi:hypothetical protein